MAYTSQGQQSDPLYGEREVAPRNWTILDIFKNAMMMMSGKAQLESQRLANVNSGIMNRRAEVQAKNAEIASKYNLDTNYVFDANGYIDPIATAAMREEREKNKHDELLSLLQVQAATQSPAHPTSAPQVFITPTPPPPESWTVVRDPYSGKLVRVKVEGGR